MATIVNYKVPLTGVPTAMLYLIQIRFSAVRERWRHRRVSLLVRIPVHFQSRLVIRIHPVDLGHYPHHPLLRVHPVGLRRSLYHLLLRVHPAALRRSQHHQNPLQLPPILGQRHLQSSTLAIGFPTFR